MRQQLIQLGSAGHALALQILGNSEDAADAVHDAFETVLRRPEAYSADKGPLKPWFLRVVRNRCIDMLRRRRPEDHRTDALASCEASSEQQLGTAQRREAVRSGLMRLGAGKRELIVLRDFLDLSYADIAAVLGIPVGTVMSRLHRARTALADELRHDTQSGQDE